MPLLSARALAVPFPAEEPADRWILSPTELDLDGGEVVAVRGPSGSGKTTFLRALALLEPRAEGEVLFHDEPVPDARVPAFRRAVCYVPQQPPRFPGTVEASLAAPFRFRAAAGAFDPSRARHMLERLALPADVLGRRLQDLSVGESQRTALVRSLLGDPQILLLDEPTSALDPDSRATAETLLEEWMTGGGRAAVLVSHDPAQIARLATRTLLLEAGTLSGGRR